MADSISGGLGLCPVLFIIFLVLKLVGVIAWSWWWVFSPLLIAAGLGTLFIVLGILAISR